MGLAIVVFVPEGIVIASDGLSEIRNTETDHGFLQHKQKRLFIFQNKYIVNLHGNGYIKGIPYAYYIEKVFISLNNETFCSVKDFAEIFIKELSRITEDNNVSFYIAGIDRGIANGYVPVVLLYDNGKINVINRGNDNSIVYNYYSIGRNLWLNKTLLPTSFEFGKEKIDFENVNIDFSKYSIDEAIDFSRTLINFSRKMDCYAQLKQMIGEYIEYGIITLDGKITKISYNNL